MKIFLSQKCNDETIEKFKIRELAHLFYVIICCITQYIIHYKYIYFMIINNSNSLFILFLDNYTINLKIFLFIWDILIWLFCSIFIIFINILNNTIICENKILTWDSDFANKTFLIEFICLLLFIIPIFILNKDFDLTIETFSFTDMINKRKNKNKNKKL